MQAQLNTRAFSRENTLGDRWPYADTTTAAAETPRKARRTTPTTILSPAELDALEAASEAGERLTDQQYREWLIARGVVRPAGHARLADAPTSAPVAMKLANPAKRMAASTIFRVASRATVARLIDEGGWLGEWLARLVARRDGQPAPVLTRHTRHRSTTRRATVRDGVQL